MKTRELVPLLISILVILLIAVLQKQSKLIAAVTATMPLTVTLALWIVYASSEGERGAVTQFSLSMVLSILPTVAFLVAAWLAARRGMGIGGIILVGYMVWGLGFAGLLALRTTLGLQ